MVMKMEDFIFDTAESIEVNTDYGVGDKCIVIKGFGHNTESKNKGSYEIRVLGSYNIELLISESTCDSICDKI